MKVDFLGVMFLYSDPPLQVEGPFFRWYDV